MGTRWNEPYGSIRLIGIDAPERSQSTFGSTATRALKRLVPVGSVVKTEMDVEPRDRYGRVPGYVWFEDELVNWIMVRAGYAVTLTFPPDVRYVDEFRAAQSTARSDEAGLWAVDGFACEPVAYRRGECG